MNKRKTGAFLLLSLLLIAAFALLPRIVAQISDIQAAGKLNSAPMQSIELAFDSEKENMTRKLALEMRMTTIPIEPKQASMTEAEVIDAAKANMDAYAQVGLFAWFDYTYCSVEPYLAIDSEQKNNISIIWGVTFSDQNDPYKYLFLHIDDETGKILYISYETSDKEQYPLTDRTEQEQMLTGFVDAFFRPLALTTENAQEASVIEWNLADDTVSTTFTFEDTKYRTICVQMYIMPVGFQVSFPQS